MPEHRRSRRLEEVSHLFLSGKGSTRSGGVTGSFIDVCVTGDEFCRGFLAAGLSSALASPDINVTLIETGTSLPNAGYYFGLEAVTYLGPALGRSDCIDMMRSPSFRYIYAVRSGDLPGQAAGFAFPGNPHTVLNVFGSPDLSAGGAIPEGSGEVPEGLFPEGEGACRRGLVFFVDSGPGTDIGIVSSYTMMVGSPAVLIASYGGEGGNIPDIPGVEVGKMGVPGNLGKALAVRMPPSGSFFNALAARVIRMTGPKREGKIRDVSTQR